MRIQLKGEKDASEGKTVAVNHRRRTATHGGNPMSSETSYSLRFARGGLGRGLDGEHYICELNGERAR